MQIVDYVRAGDTASLRDMGQVQARQLSELASRISKSHPEEARAVMARTNSVSASLNSQNAAEVGAAVLELAEARFQLEQIADKLTQKRVDVGLAGMSGVTDSLFSSAVKQVTIKSTMTPDITYTPGPNGQATKTTGGGPGEWILAALKPSFEVQTPAGPLKVAPYGEPTENYFWPVVAGLGALALGTGFFTVKGVKASLGSSSSKRHRNPSRLRLRGL